jgi:hypothetical protein
MRDRLPVRHADSGAPMAGLESWRREREPWALPTIAVLLLGYGALSGRLQSTVVTQAMTGPPSTDIHDIVGNDDHVVVIGTASATAGDGSGAEWKYVQIFHIQDGKATEVWGMAENDAAVDPFLDGLPG